MKTALSETWLCPVEETSVLAALEEQAQAHPEWPDMQNRNGLRLMLAGDLDGARGAFDRCLELNPRYGWATLNLAAVLALESRFREARDVLQTAMDPAPGARSLSEGWVAVLERRPDAGLAALSRIPQRLHDRADVRWLQAALSELQEGADTEGAWRRVLDESLVRSWFHEVDALRRPCRDGQRAGGLFPGLHQLWLAVSTLHGQAGAFARADTAARRAYLFWSDRAVFRNHAGGLAMMRGDAEEARSQYEQAYREAPLHPGAPAKLAAYWRHRGDMDHAAELLRAALSAAPGFADLHRQLGQVEASRGNKAESIRCFRRALDAHPLFSIVRMELADALYESGQWDEAREAYGQALNTGLRTSRLFLHLGRCLEELARPEEAESAYREALELDPENAQPYYRLGVLYRNQGRPRDAKTAWTAYLALTEHGCARDADKTGGSVRRRAA